VAEWQRSAPEPGKDYPGSLSQAAEIPVNRSYVRNAPRSAALLEPLNASSPAAADPRPGVIILTVLFRW